jgi:outer membrane protein OmpA-like peptidoglycan-associated protein
MIRRRAVAVVAAFAIGCTAACAQKSARLPDNRGRDLIVLLPDADGTVGRAVVSTPEGAVDLAAARASTTVAAKGSPAAVVTMSEADVRKVFGAALASLPPSPQSFTLYFKFQSEELTPDSRKLAWQVVDLLKNRPSPEVVVRGHTDTTGSKARNFDLGLKRANTVRSLLINTGVDAAAIDVISHGESELLIPTGDEVSEPRNRRVEVTIR